jgi:alkylation response protein AidB-like acyl-CoA dehydrogenase
MSARMDARRPDCRRRRTRKEFARAAAAHDASGTLPGDNFQALNAAGLLRLTIARADGGYGADLS